MRVLSFKKGERTVRYIGAGAVFGFEEIAHNWRCKEDADRQGDEMRPLASISPAAPPVNAPARTMRCGGPI
jgi:hypothetical protein